MSWTSEFELPPQGPQVLPAEAETVVEFGEPDELPHAEETIDSAGDDDAAAGLLGEADDGHAFDDVGDRGGDENNPEPVDETLDGPGFELSDIPEDGPLDPSVFDGLFADLTEPVAEPEDYVQPREFESDPDHQADHHEDDRHEDDHHEDDEATDAGLGTENEEAAAEYDEGDENDELAESDKDGFAEHLDEYVADQEDDTHTDDGLTDEDLVEDQYIDAEDLLEDGYTEDQDSVEDRYTEDEDPVEDQYTQDEDPVEDRYTEDEDPTEEQYTEEDEDPTEDQYTENELVQEEDLRDGHGDDDPGFEETASPVHQLFEPVPANPSSDPIVQVQVLEQPLPAVATSPPIAFDEHQTDANQYEATPYYEVPAAEVVDQLNPTLLTAETPRRWPAFVTAILIGGTLGIGGAIALTTLQQSDNEDQAASVTAPITANEVNQQPTVADQQTSDNDDPTPDGTATGQQAASSLLTDGELALSSIRFVPGTTDLSSSSQETLQRVAEAVEGDAPEPTTITVRTFTEPTAQANLDLSVQQAEAINQYLASLGVEFGGVSARGIGAAPLQSSLPVPNFVAVKPNLQATGLKQAISDIGPFEIGIDPDSLQLRPESVEALATIGSALTANSGSISLAGYSYDRPNSDANKAMASAAVDAAVGYLVENHQIDPARLSPLTPGSFPYVLGSDDGGHVDIKRGRSAAVEVAVNSLDHSVLAFASGSDALSGAATEELTRIASLVSEAEAVAVISVRSAGESSSEANNRLSELQAAAIGSFLSDAGLSDEQFRVYGIGDVAKLRTDSTLSEVNITILS